MPINDKYSYYGYKSFRRHCFLNGMRERHGSFEIT